MNHTAWRTLQGRGVRALLVLFALTIWGVLTGCAFPAQEKLGALRADVVARLGPPTATYPLPTGERLLYSQLPAGSEAYVMDFDAAHRLVRNEQMLTQTHFERIPLDTWTRADVERNFGPPLRVEQVARFDGNIWTYRFRDNGEPRQAHVHIDPAGVVQRVMFTDERLNDNDPFH